MGYLTLPDGISDFTKAVISIWFRAPSATIAAAASAYAANSGSIANDLIGIRTPALIGVIPLLTFGSSSDSPSYIGLDVSGSNNANFCANLQMAETAIGQTYTSGFSGPDRYLIGGGFDLLPITADGWHHFLVSFDLSNGCSSHMQDHQNPEYWHVDSWSYFWLAIDDVDKNGTKLAPSGNGTDWNGAGPGFPLNGILSSGVQSLLTGVTGATDLSGAPIFASGNPLALPTDGRYVDNVYNVAMARVQVFTGVSLDTSVEENRRAFITSGRKPAALSLARGLLGVAPVVEFDKAVDFIAGRNTGTAGNFTKTGTVTAYASGP